MLHLEWVNLSLSLPVKILSWLQQNMSRWKFVLQRYFYFFYFGGWYKQLEFSILKYLKIRRKVFILGCISVVTYTHIKHKINWWAIVRNGIKRERGSIHFKFKSYFSVYCWTHHLVDLYWCLFYRNKNVLMLFYWT